MTRSEAGRAVAVATDLLLVVPRVRWSGSEQ